MSKECKKARNVVISTALILMAIIIVMSMSSCGSTSPYHACGITELNKQYKAKCKSRK